MGMMGGVGMGMGMYRGMGMGMRGIGAQPMMQIVSFPFDDHADQSEAIFDLGLCISLLRKHGMHELA